jgi:hypothetical protein
VCLLPAEVVRRLPLPLRLRDLPRCSLCPLFDPERAIRDVLGANPPSAGALETMLGVRVWALLRGELLPSLTRESAPSLEFSGFAPEEWEERADESYPS